MLGHDLATKNIFLTGGSLNKISKETFESMFGSEINETLTENLKNIAKNNACETKSRKTQKIDFGGEKRA